jgi:putative protease
MKKNYNKIELLAPAGSLEKLQYAIHYGADAVYAGLPDLSMRARINSFTLQDLAEATNYVHEHGKKIFVTINIYAHNYHLPKLEKHLKELKKIPIDGVIIADAGILMLVKKHLPEVEIHLSTQANTTNWQAAKFWYQQGVTRVVLAREVSLDDIREIHKHVPKLELEYFVHGAMCMSYSGRCILSKWMTGKSANLGDCSQPCRWKYNVKEEPAEVKTVGLEEVQGRYGIDLEEDKQGTYFFNSKDLKLLEHLKELMDAGVYSFKIEGRNKSVFYVAAVVRAYRRVVDALEEGLNDKTLKKIVREETKELDKIMNRGYTKGFLLGYEPEHNFYQTHVSGGFQFVGEILESDGLLKVKVHNAIYPDDSLEILGKEKNTSVKILEIFDEKKQTVTSAHGGHGNLYYLKVNKKNIEAPALIRKIVNI